MNFPSRHNDIHQGILPDFSTPIPQKRRNPAPRQLVEVAVILATVSTVACAFEYVLCSQDWNIGGYNNKSLSFER